MLQEATPEERQEMLQELTPEQIVKSLSDEDLKNLSPEIRARILRCLTQPSPTNGGAANG